jgi:hypothetical protein
MSPQDAFLWISMGAFEVESASGWRRAISCRAMRSLVAVLLVLACSACTSASSGPRSTVITYPEGLPGNDTTVYPPTPDVYVPPILVAPIDDASADGESGLIDVMAVDTSDDAPAADGTDGSVADAVAADAGGSDAADASPE